MGKPVLLSGVSWVEHILHGLELSQPYKILYLAAALLHIESYMQPARFSVCACLQSALSSGLAWVAWERERERANMPPAAWVDPDVVLRDRTRSRSPRAEEVPAVPWRPPEEYALVWKAICVVCLTSRDNFNFQRFVTPDSPQKSTAVVIQDKQVQQHTRVIGTAMVQRCVHIFHFPLAGKFQVRWSLLSLGLLDVKSPEMIVWVRIRDEGGMSTCQSLWPSSRMRATGMD
jgi:hypothetical protein